MDSLVALSRPKPFHSPIHFFNTPKLQLRHHRIIIIIIATNQISTRSVLKFKQRTTTSVSFYQQSDEDHIISSSSSSGSSRSNYNEMKKKGKGWVHFVGIGGSGLSALAMLALKQGFKVTGSDLEWSSYMNGLHQAGACLYIGHSASNIQSESGLSFPHAIVVSSAIAEDNVEVRYAKSIGVTMYKRDDWLGKLTKPYNLIAVAGSHGKSTTTSMLAYVLKAMGDDLTAVVGAQVPQFSGGNIICGAGQNFVIEADEYDGCFLGLSPNVAVVTNLDWEHVDIYHSEEAVKSIFLRFIKQIRVGGHLIICGDDQGANSLLDRIKQAPGSENSTPASIDQYKITTYGISSYNEWHASSIHLNTHGGSEYILCHKGRKLAEISLQIPGIHNVFNSLAVIATVLTMADDESKSCEIINSIKLHIGNFIGVSRRFEMVGKVQACHIYDDYAHHPTEVRAVIQAARGMFPSHYLLVVLQPHTYSRLAALKDDFAAALSLADCVVVTEVYAARETNYKNVSGKDLASSIIGPPSEYIPSLSAVVDELVLQIADDPERKTVVLTLGAGNITTVGPRLLRELQERLSESCKYVNKNS
ncbi:hypothetical protein ACFE04_027299 [Oxalis oulophora]